MADNAVVPCPSCGEKCAVATQHLSRRLACPHCGDEFVPSESGRGGGRRGGGGGRGGGGRGGRGGGGGGGRRRAGSSSNPMMAVGGVAVLLLLIVGVAVMGSKKSGRTGRSRDTDNSGSTNVEKVSETVARNDQASRRNEGPVDPASTMTWSTPPSGNYSVNGTIFNATVSVRLWRDPHKLSEGRKAGLIKHQDSVEAIGVGTNNKGIKVYRVRGKSKLGGRSVEGFVSAFYIEKDHVAVAEHKWEWVDPDDWERHGISPEDRE